MSRSSGPATIPAPAPSAQNVLRRQLPAGPDMRQVCYVAMDGNERLPDHGLDEKAVGPYPRFLEWMRAGLLPFLRRGGRRIRAKMWAGHPQHRDAQGKTQNYYSSALWGALHPNFQRFLEEDLTKILIEIDPENKHGDVSIEPHLGFILAEPLDPRSIIVPNGQAIQPDVTNPKHVQFFALNFIPCTTLKDRTGGRVVMRRFCWDAMAGRVELLKAWEPELARMMVEGHVIEAAPTVETRGIATDPRGATYRLDVAKMEANRDRAWWLTFKHFRWLVCGNPNQADEATFRRELSKWRVPAGIEAHVAIEKDDLVSAQVLGTLIGLGWIPDSCFGMDEDTTNLILDSYRTRRT